MSYRDFPELIQREEVMIGASEMRGRYQSQPAGLALDGQLTVFTLTLGTEVARTTEPLAVLTVQVTHAHGWSLLLVCTQLMMRKTHSNE